MTSIQIHIAKDLKEKERIYEFRYRVHAMGFGENRPEIDHQKQWIKDNLDDHSLHFYASYNGKCVGALRLTVYSNETKKALESIYPHLSELCKFNIGKASVTSRFMLDPTIRGHTLVSLIMRKVFELALESNIAINLAYLRSELKMNYERLGYRQAFPISMVGSSPLVPMLLCLQDKKHLMSVMSPFANLVPQQLDDHGEIAFKLKQAFPNFENQPHIPTSRTEYFWAEIADSHARLYQSRPSLSDGLVAAEIELLKNLGETLTISEGELIDLSRGAARYGMILKGALGEKITRDNETSHWLELYREGDSFGEPRVIKDIDQWSSFVALQDTEVVLIPPLLIESLKRKDPLLATRLSMNLLSFMQYYAGSVEQGFDCQEDDDEDKELPFLRD